MCVVYFRVLASMSFPQRPPMAMLSDWVLEYCMCVLHISEWWPACRSPSGRPWPCSPWGCNKEVMDSHPWVRYLKSESLEISTLYEILMGKIFCVEYQNILLKRNVCSIWYLYWLVKDVLLWALVAYTVFEIVLGTLVDIRSTNVTFGGPALILVDQRNMQ